MMTSKFVGYFLEQVSGWQKKLSNADAVISIWMEVQRTWSHLESIFIGSEDIRAQLPEHSKTFDTVDSDFKVRIPLIRTVQLCTYMYLPLLLYLCLLQRLLQEIEKTPNVVKGTNRARLYEELEDIQGRYVFVLHYYFNFTVKLFLTFI